MRLLLPFAFLVLVIVNADNNVDDSRESTEDVDEPVRYVGRPPRRDIDHGHPSARPPRPILPHDVALHPENNPNFHPIIPDIQGDILGSYPSNADIYELAHKLGYRDDLDSSDAYSPKGTLNGPQFSKELKSLLSFNDFDVNAHEASYATGYIGGKKTGEQEGYATGEQRGYKEGNERGYEDGHKEGFKIGKFEGYDSGQEAGAVIGFVGSYDLAVHKGIRIGMRKGYRDAYHHGYDDGSHEGYNDGYKEGLERAIEAVKQGRNPEELLLESEVTVYANPRAPQPVDVPSFNVEEFLNLPRRVHPEEEHIPDGIPHRVPRPNKGGHGYHNTTHTPTEHPEPEHHNTTHTPTPTEHNSTRPHHHHSWEEVDEWD